MLHEKGRRTRREAQCRFDLLAAARAAAAVLLPQLAFLACTDPAQAQEVPPGAELIMSDWILGSFVVFFCSGLVVFIIAARMGLFRNIESAKYYLLTIEEKDYYTPDWAKEE